MLETAQQQRVKVENTFYLVGAAACYVASSLTLLQADLALGAQDIIKPLIVLNEHFERHSNAVEPFPFILFPLPLELFPNLRNYDVKESILFAVALCDIMYA